MMQPSNTINLFLMICTKTRQANVAASRNKKYGAGKSTNPKNLAMGVNGKMMPIAMIIIMALIQDAPFRDYQELKIPLLLVNNDKGDFGKTIEADLKRSKIFEISQASVSETEAKENIANGKYEIGIVVI